jgi:hypothetical protein
MGDLLEEAGKEIFGLAQAPVVRDRLRELDREAEIVRDARAASELTESRGFSGSWIGDSSCRPGAEAGRHVEGAVA